ncbi:MAG: glycine cleavage system protein H [Chloroflexi bacterium]|nr:glycine cleavage system protein H [Chloroflexota bacterium]|tara:strand:+ start:142 stop:525 length:384 start_codon:yes stop_codon:yes gene_type:complete
MYPENLKYSEEHEWLLEDNGIATIGITDFAVDSLGDIVFIELPDKGSQIKQFTTFGEVESVKAASEIYTPISGEIIEVNEKLETEPELLNNSPYEEGWLIKVKISDLSEIEKLMNSKDYENFVNNGN